MKTTRPLTPIERAMDRALGYTGSGAAPVFVTLRCPECKHAMQVKADETDPEGTAVVEALCPDCDDGGGFPEVLYFDRGGNQIFPE